MAAPPAHIAGVGVSSSRGKDVNVDELAVAAGTKAMLDAGVSYDDVDQSIACFLDDKLRIRPACLHTFGMRGASISEVDNRSGLFAAIQGIRSGQSNCTIVIGFDKNSAGGDKAQVMPPPPSGSRRISKEADPVEVLAVGIVVVSQAFLTSHAYLKDAAVCIRGSAQAARFHSRQSSGPNDKRTTRTAVDLALRQAQLQPKDFQIVELRPSSNLGLRETLNDFRVSQPREPSKSLESFDGTTGLAGLCGLVWQLRGWAHDRPVSQLRNCLQYVADPSGAASVLVLGRSDNSVAPGWKLIQNLRDGRERLGHNPAVDMRDISHEDLESVRTKAEFTSDEAANRVQLKVRGGDRAALARL